MLTKDHLKATNPVISHDNHSGSEVTTEVSGPDKEDTGSYFIIIPYDLCRKISLVFNDANQEAQEDLFTAEVTIAYELLATDIRYVL